MPGEAALLEQLLDLIGLHAEILRDERHRTERLLDGVKQLHAGPLAPLAVDGGLLVRADLPVSGKTAKMVETYHVEQRHVALHAPDPPRVVFRLVRCPVVHGVAPQLTGCRIVIGRYACHQLGTAVRLQLEQLGVCPYIGRVGGNVNRDVTDDLNALFVGILAQCRPLLEENILQKIRKSTSSRSSAVTFRVLQACGRAHPCPATCRPACDGISPP